MLESADEHLAWILEKIAPTEATACPLAEARGLALAESVHAKYDLPMWDASAMDGYAVRAEDAAEANALLRVAGEISAGSAEDPVIPVSGAIRIMTGAPVPSAADTVIPVEETESDRPGEPWAESSVRVVGAVRAGSNIRRRGEDIRSGQEVGRRGDRLTAARMSAIAAVGVSSVVAHRPPRIAVVTTGSELANAGEQIRRGLIPESNSVLVAEMLTEAGIEPVTIEHCDDDPHRISALIDRLASTHDAIVTTGGIGPGLHDIVRIALDPEPEIRALRVALRPGQLQCAGRHSKGAFVFALPGNPVSVAVSFEVFVRPALLALSGHSRIHRLRLTATATEAWSGSAGRLKVLPVRIEQGRDGLTCAPVVVAQRVSHSVAAHGSADGYAFVEVDRDDVQVGDRVQVIQVGVR